MPSLRAALEAGKNVYVKNPWQLPRRWQENLELAKNKDLLVGTPDTFLGAGLQTCRKLIDDGWIGEPVAATAFHDQPWLELAPGSSFTTKSVEDHG